MPESLLEIDVDPSAILLALEKAGPIAEAYCRQAASQAADHIQTEARARVRRATGATAAAITKEAAPGPLGGFRVFVGPTRDIHGYSRPANLPFWIEFGTVKMAAAPFLFAAARLEEQPYLRSLSHAIQDAIDGAGLGE